MSAAPGRGRFLPLMAALSATAWLTLWLWGRNSYSRYLDHGNWTEIGVAGALCRALPGGSEALTGLLVVAGWLLMLAAMMLPTTLPLLDIFRRVTARRVDRRSLVEAGGSQDRRANDPAIGEQPIRPAHASEDGPADKMRGEAKGAPHGEVPDYDERHQFSALKYRCLDKCRAPLGFVIEHWRGAHYRWQAFVLGGRHGAFCLGCCWALMLIMFVVGSANIGWMLALGAVMAAERNLSSGRRLAAPLGALLLLAALWTALAGAIARA